MRAHHPDPTTPAPSSRGWRAGVVVALAVGVALAGCSSSPEPAASPETATSPAPARPAGPHATAPDLPGGESVRCENPEGFAVSAPASWATNGGDVVARCGQFHPEPFELSGGTDQRVAAIAAYVDPVLFATVSAPLNRRDEVRAVTAVDGRQAVRISYRTAAVGLYPEGTPVTAYFVDMQPEGGRPATLIMNTLGLPPFDYEANTVVLDRMFRTLEITDASVATAPNVIAAYRRGGGGGVSVVAEATGEGICLSVSPDGEEFCAVSPGSHEVQTIVLRSSDGSADATVHAGVTGAGVWRVDLVTSSGETFSYLPAPVPGSDAGAYAFHGLAGGFERIVLYDVTAKELRTVERRG